MRKVLNPYFLLMVFLGILGCSSYTKIYSYSDDSIDFKKYRTFAWLPDSGMSAKKDSFRNAAFDNDIIRNNAKNYVTSDLNKRGLRVQPDSPDALFQLVLRNERLERVVSNAPYYYSPYYYYRNPIYYPYYYPYYDYYTYYGWDCRNEYCDYSTVHQQVYQRGTITVNMFDRELKRLVWTGSAEGDIYDPSFIQEDVHPTIKRIMNKFPIKEVSQQTPLAVEK